MDSRKNSFDFLRLLFACLVIIAHSYPLSGTSDCDFWCQITNKQFNFSDFRVMGFFVLSGYLIFHSLQRSEDLVSYYWKRFLRLFPGLFVVLLITILMVPFLYRSDISIFKNKSIITYIPYNLMLYKAQIIIDGVFEKNVYPIVVNGSLWTIPYEFTLYVLISLLFFIRRKVTLLKWIISVLFILLLIGNIFFIQYLKEVEFILVGKHMLRFSVFYMAGTLLAVFNFEKIKRQKEFLILVVLLLMASYYFELFKYSKYILLPFFYILVGLMSIPMLHTIVSKIGDLSYGIFIYGFFVQQTLMFYFKLNHIELMLSSLLISFCFGYFSWHVVEKKALRLKNINPITIWKNGGLKKIWTVLNSKDTSSIPVSARVTPNNN